MNTCSCKSLPCSQRALPGAGLSWKPELLSGAFQLASSYQGLKGSRTGNKTFLYSDALKTRLLFCFLFVFLFIFFLLRESQYKVITIQCDPSEGRK